MIWLLSEHPVSATKLAYWRLNPPQVRVVSRLSDVPAYEVLISKLSYCPRTLRLWHAISLRPGPYGLHRVQCLPELPSWRTWLKFAMPPKWMGIRAADFVICAGTASEVHPLIGPFTDRIRTVSPDFWRLEDCVSPLPVSTPYAVFLDEGEDGSHTDYDTLHLDRVDTWRYRFEMQELFNQVTKETGLPVITAFRENGQTPALVAHADLVLTHSSTAVSFAVWLKKPIRVLIPPCFRGRPNERNARAMAIALKNYDSYERQYLGVSA